MGNNPLQTKRLNNTTMAQKRSAFFQFISACVVTLCFLSVFSVIDAQQDSILNKRMPSKKTKSIVAAGKGIAANALAVSSYSREGSAVTILTNKGACLRVMVCAPGIIRFGFYPEGEIVAPVADISKQDWLPAQTDITDNKNEIQVCTQLLAIKIQKDPLKIDIIDPVSGKVILRDPDSGGLSWDEAKIKKTVQAEGEEHYFGLGMQETGELELAHKVYQTRKPWSGYSYVPFFIDTRGYGIYVNTFREMEFDFSGPVSFTLPAKSLDYYFIYGPGIPEIVEGFTLVTGRAPMPPKWFLGFIISKYGDENATFDEMTGIQSRLRDENYPVDLFVYDYGWRGHEYMGSPAWRIDRHPELLEHMKRLHYKYQLHYACYAHDFPNLSVIDNQVLDITAPGADEILWQKWFAPRVDEGMNMILLDGALTWPHVFIKSDKVRFSNGMYMDEMSSYYQYLLSKILYEKMTRYTGLRTFVQVPCSNNAGLQKYTFLWSGDIGNSEADMAEAIAGFLSMGLCGHPYFSHDLGGFKKRPSSEGYTRWVGGLGVFCPVMRTHGHGGREPWLFNDLAQQTLRKYDKLRYRLMPYNYTYAHEAFEKGYPIARPMVWKYQDTPAYFKDLSLQYFWGDDFLVRPVPAFSDTSVNVFLPPGMWYDYWTGKTFRGPLTITCKAVLDMLPLFVKAGAIIPMAPEMYYTGQKSWSPLTLDIYPGTETASFTLYEDDGISFQYEEGKYALTEFSCTTGESALHVSIGETRGDYPGMMKSRMYNLIIHHVEKPGYVKLDGKEIPGVAKESISDGVNGWYYNEADHTLYVSLEKISSGMVAVQCRQYETE